MKEDFNPKLCELLKSNASQELVEYVKKNGLGQYVDQYREIIKKNDIQLPIAIANAGHAQVRNALIWEDMLYGVCHKKTSLPYLITDEAVNSTPIFTSHERAETFIDENGIEDTIVVQLPHRLSNKEESSINRKRWIQRAHEFGVDAISVDPHNQEVQIYIDISQLMIFHRKLINDISDNDIDLTREALFLLYYLAQNSDHLSVLDSIVQNDWINDMYLMLTCDRVGNPIRFIARERGELVYHAYSCLDEVSGIGKLSCNEPINVRSVKLKDILVAAKEQKCNIVLNPFGTKLWISRKLFD